MTKRRPTKIAPPAAAAGDAAIPRPAMRSMSVIAQDPSVLDHRGNILMAKISVPAEALVEGPTGYRVQVVDFDATTGHFHGSHQLPETFEREPARWRDGDPSLVDDYTFHAQNIYALVMKTLSRFEYALGRRIGWSFKTHQLKVAPHGMMDANAFYSPLEEGLVFGYFIGRHRQVIHTCLSHDVVVHETTHALLDALRERYLDPSSPDQAAFHEGFADVIALLSVFSQPEIVARLLEERPTKRATRSKRPVRRWIKRDRLTEKELRQSALFGLAEQMGQELNGMRGSPLRRSATLEPARDLLERDEYAEPHRRGEVLVAAVLRGFIAAWADRLEHAAGPGQDRFPVLRVAEEGADIAECLLTMWIRAIDYMPPVHLRFGDALSAALTADIEARPDDSRYKLRKRMLESFRRYGIDPASRRKEPLGVWNRAPVELHFERVRFEAMRNDPDEVFRFLWDNRERLGVHPDAFTKVLSVRPCTRVGSDGFVLRETVATYYQVVRLTVAECARKGILLPADYAAELKRQATRRARRKHGAGEVDDLGTVPTRSNRPSDDDDDPDDLTTPLYGGGVLVFDEYGRLKYHVHNDVFGRKRQKERLQYLWESGLLRADDRGARLSAARISHLHRLRAIDARRLPTEGW